MRGRLIFPFIIELYQLDTVATEADPDGAGELTSGYDEVFREPESVLANPDDQIGTSTRVESGPIQVRAQIESEFMDRLNMMMSGQSDDNLFGLVLHFRELERLGLVDDNGKAKIRIGDRLGAIYTKKGVLVENIPNPPGMFVTEVKNRSYGLGVNRNLCVLTLRDRDTSISSA